MTERKETIQRLACDTPPEAVKVSEWMENWLGNISLEHRRVLERRLQLNDYGRFAETYFELIVFTSFHRLNCHIEVHPCFEETDSTVDFCVTHGAERFYTEATVCGISRGTLYSNTNEKDAIRRIKESVAKPHSDVFLHAEGNLIKTLSMKGFISKIENLLKKYPASRVKELESDSGNFHPEISISEGDWRLTAYLAPPIDSSGKGQVFDLSRGGAFDGSMPLRRALSKKYEDWKKKKLNHDVFLVALNICHADYIQGDEKEAIYGRDDAVVGRDAFVKRLSNISGVIAFNRATLGNECSARVKLYRNSNRSVPKCLEFLKRETSLGKLLGVR